jgi:hypothetical protein
VVQALREQWKAFDEDQSRTERAVGNVRHDPNVLLPPKRIPHSYIWMLEATGGPPGGDPGDFEIVRRFGELVERQVERGILPAEKGRKRSALYILRSQGCRGPCWGDRLPGRAVSGSAELGGVGVSEARSLQPG